MVGKLIKSSLLVVAVFGLSKHLKAQQATGQFILMDGGFEGQTLGVLAKTKNSETPLKTWGYYSTKKAATLYTVSGLSARTGNNFVVLNDTSNSASAAIISPALQPSGIVGGASYVVQLYYRAHDLASLPNTEMQAGVSNETRTAAKFSKLDSNAVINNAVWLKSVFAVTAANGAAPDSGFFTFKIASGSAKSTTNGSAVDLDDIVIYAGNSADTITPPIPGVASVGGATGTTLNVSWGSASTVDSGGYLVVRYTSDPIGQPDPNTNGIYSISNSLGAGTIAYSGTDTNFVDYQLANNTTYFYRVYTVDKAFNYSTSVVASGTTTSTSAVVNFYIDSANGNDANDGRTPATAWQTIAKVNAVTFYGGDSILFNCGDTWSGTTLHPLGSGVSGSPIVVSKYGTGNLPQINGNTATSHNEDAVYLFNQQYITISNLDITNNYQATNPTDTALKKGVYVLAQDYGTVHCVILKNLVIHDVLGTYFSNAYSGGIFCNILGSTVPTLYDSLLIDSCKVYNVDRTGISNQSSWNTRTDSTSGNCAPNTNLVIQNCEVDSSGANSIIIRNSKAPVIQHNLVWKSSIRYSGNSIFVFNCDDALIQYNEGAFNVYNKGDADASAFDADYQCHRTVIQYNYSHDNDGGAYVVVSDGLIAGTFDDSCIIRYNISQNDCHKNVPSSHGIFRVDGDITNTFIYNNTTYTSTDCKNVVIHTAWGGGSTGVLPNNTQYFNNIFYINKSLGSFYLVGSTNNLFNYNNYFYPSPYTGSHPADSNALTSDPMFVSPGSGGVGINTVNGYKLQSGSPCIHSGFLRPGQPSFDFWGDSVPTTLGSFPCRGAYEAPSVMPVTLINFKGEKTGPVNSLAWATTNEVNNAGFQVQHSADGEVFLDEHFVPTKAATGNYAGIINYSYTDATPYPGTNYYRLKQIDKSGRQTFSAVIQIAASNLAAAIGVYPNPVENKVINVVLNNLAADVYNLQLINNEGKTIAGKQINHLGGSSVDALDVSSLNIKGLCFLRITSATGQTTKTVIIK